MSTHRFNAYPCLVTIEGTQVNWTAYLASPDGRRVRADFIVPNCLVDDELCQYLADLFYESATPTHGDVFLLPHAEPPAFPFPASR